MPSPFPGMDRWLELPEIFPDLQFSFTVRLTHAINQVLAAPYDANLGSRVWYVGNDDPMKECYAEVFSKPGNKELVAVFEVLSNYTKSALDPGRALYLKQQTLNLARKTNFVEIDMLRTGEKTTFAATHSSILLRSSDYHISIRRYNGEKWLMVQAWQLQGRMPRLQLPIVPAGHSVSIDLQEILEECYDSGNMVRINYRETPPTLSKAQQNGQTILKSKADA